MKVVAILETYNEERAIGACLENLTDQGVEAYLFDNSSDRTIDIAKRYLGKGLTRIQTIPYPGKFSLREQLKRKEELAVTLEADWLIHVDADEILLPPRSDITLAQAFARVEDQGYNAVNFLEFLFIPTQESPDHDHPNFQKTMKSYYYFQPFFPVRLIAWKNQHGPVDLTTTGGHQVRFPGLRMYPESFRMRHYPFLSISQLVRKYVNKQFDQTEVKDGWHGWRAKLKAEMVRLPLQSELETYVSDDLLDSSHPWSEHYLAKLVAASNQTLQEKDIPRTP